MLSWVSIEYCPKCDSGVYIEFLNLNSGIVKSMCIECGKVRFHPCTKAVELLDEIYDLKRRALNVSITEDEFLDFVSEGWTKRVNGFVPKSFSETQTDRKT